MYCSIRQAGLSLLSGMEEIELPPEIEEPIPDSIMFDMSSSASFASDKYILRGLFKKRYYFFEMIIENKFVSHYD